MLFFFLLYKCVFVSPLWFVAVKRRGYKTPGVESPSRLQYHSHSSGGSREARPMGRLETAELLRMALDVLGPSI